jgi:uncharacterized protein (TIGR02246 family)
MSDDPARVATAIFDKMTQIWNEQGKTDTEPSMFTDDADLINAMGPHWRGRADIVANTKGIQMTYRPHLAYKLTCATEIAPGLILAIVNGTATIPAGQPGAGKHALSQSMLLAKRGADWKVRFIQSTPIVAPPAPTRN